jgi:site-specific recombinase XerC
LDAQEVSGRLMAYCAGFRVSESIDVRLQEIDLRTARMQVRRLKGSMSAKHPVEGGEPRAFRAWLRNRDTPAPKRLQSGRNSVSFNVIQ